MVRSKGRGGGGKEVEMSKGKTETIMRAGRGGGRGGEAYEDAADDRRERESSVNEVFGGAEEGGVAFDDLGELEGVELEGLTDNLVGEVDDLAADESMSHPVDDERVLLSLVLLLLVWEVGDAGATDPEGG